MTIKYEFPKNFLWGASSSGPQSEGANKRDSKGESIWDFWYEKNPELFFNQVGPKDTSTFYDNYKSDIALMKKVGLNSFRTSIQWSRLMPDKTGKLNEKAVKFYSNVIDELNRNGILPIINLFHFDMPMWAQKLGGWESREVVDYYVKYAKKCFELFGDKVTLWTTFNEPIFPAEMGYMADYHYPCVKDGRRAAQVAYHTMLASAIATREFHKMDENDSSSIGIILNLTPTYPKNFKKEHVKAANCMDLFFNRSFLDPAVHGKYPKELIALLEENDAVPIHDERDLQIIEENTVDFLGVNYYTPRRAQARKKPYKSDVFMPEKYYETYQWPLAKMNIYRGWEIYEDGLYDICDNIIKNYGNIPFYISENGMGVEGEERFINDKGQIEDYYRIDFVKEHLKRLHKGILAGANCFGYHMWTYIDNWSWRNAYKNRYGFVSLNLETQKRTIKKSGEWFAQVSKNNGFN